jgi:hypothetical protein
VCLKIQEKEKIMKYKKKSKVSQIWARGFKKCGRHHKKIRAKNKKIKKSSPSAVL